MKIELIIPLPKQQFNSSKMYPTLGIPMIAAVTPSEYDVKITTISNIKELKINDVDLVGITAMTSYAPLAYKIANEYRAKGITVVMGGIHCSVMPDESINYCDSIVIGEGESVWPILLNDFKKRQLKNIYKADEFISLNNIPFSRVDLLDSNKYFSRSVLHATRGCIYNCNFCSVTNFFGNKYRLRPVEEVIKEIKYLIHKKLGNPDNYIIFNDDNIACNKNYANKLFNELIHLNIKWAGQSNLNIASDEDLLQLAKKSGCDYLFIGIESLSDKNLKEVNKDFNITSKYEEYVKKIHDCGISIVGSFIFGLDYDDESVFENTLNFVKKNNIEVPIFCALTPFPGTSLYKKMLSEDRIIVTDWRKYNLTNVVFKPKLISPQVLQNGINLCYREISNINSEIYIRNF